MAIQRSTLVTKAQELMKTEGLDGASAAKKARDMMTATTPVTSTPTSTVATTPIQPTPVTPQTIVNAPVDPTTGLSKPLEQTQTVAPTPAPVAPEIKYANNPDGTPVTAEVKPPEPVKTTVASKTEAPIDYNKSQGREGEIQTNIKQITTDNPALLKDRNSYNQAFGYDTADQGKKAMLDASFSTGNQVPTASAMYNAIVGKADIPEEQKLTPSYKIAQNRYTKANMFSGITPSQLANEMKNVKLVEGSQTFEDLKAINPKLVQDATNLRKVNGGTSNIFTYTNNPDGSTTKVNNLEKTFADDFLDNFAEEIKKMYAVQTPEQIRAIIRTPDVVNAEDKSFEFEGKINEIDKQIADSDAEVEARLAGSGASGNRIALEKSSAREKFNKDRDSLVKEYTRYANKANDLTTQNMTLYTTQQQQKQAQNAAMLPFITDQYKTQQEKINSEQALNDPQTQIQATMDEFAKMGITAQGNTASKIAEFKASGLSLPDYITRLRGQFMSKPEYKKALELEQGKMSDTQKMNAQQAFDIQKIKLQDSMKDKNIQRVGGTTDNPIYGYFDGNKIVTVNMPTANSQTYNPANDTLTTVTLESGKPITMLSQPANALSALINANPDVKIDYNNLYRTQTDQLKLYGKGRTSEELIKDGVPSLYADPLAKKVTWTTKSEHMKGNAVDLVSPTPATIAKMNSAGFYRPDATMKAGDTGHFEYRGAQGTSESQISPEAKSYIDIYNAGTMDLETILTKLGTSKEVTPLKNEIINAVASQGGKTVRTGTDPAVVSLQKRIDDIKFLKDDPYLTSVVGTNALGRTSLSNFYSGGKDEYLSKVKQFFASDVLQSLIDAKSKGATFGALSDSELTQLKNASNSLAGRAVYDGDNIVGFKGSEETFKAELEKLALETQKAIDKMTGNTNINKQSNTAPAYTPEAQSIENEWLNR